MHSAFNSLIFVALNRRSSKGELKNKKMKTIKGVTSVLADIASNELMGINLIAIKNYIVSRVNIASAPLFKLTVIISVSFFMQHKVNLLN